MKIIEVTEVKEVKTSIKVPVLEGYITGCILEPSCPDGSIACADCLFNANNMQAFTRSLNEIN